MNNAVMDFTRTDTLLSVENVSLSFGETLVLRDINVKIDNLIRPGHDGSTGQIIAFLGPSGIGKTQFLRILAGLQKPTTGHVYLGTERRIVRPGSVGMVSQKYHLYRNRNVMSNLMVAAKQTGCTATEAETRCKEMLKRFDLLHRANLYPAQLSGGQQQRVAIAQQLLCSEHFLLMDEPTAGLDVKNKNRVAKMVQEVANQHDLNTIILVTHDITSALAVADTVWLMGRERDASGNIIPGAKIVEELDLVKQGMTWHPNIRKELKFSNLVRYVEERFETL